MTQHLGPRETSKLIAIRARAKRRGLVLRSVHKSADISEAKWLLLDSQTGRALRQATSPMTLRQVEAELRMREVRS